MSKSSRGATLIETALSIGLFIVFTFFIIDLARYFFVYAVLNYAAFQAADYASKNELEIQGDAGYCAEQDINPLGSRCARFETLINEMHNRARNTAHLVATDPGTPSRVTLVDFEQYRKDDYPDCGLSFCASDTGLTTTGCLLRPGELCWRATGPGTSSSLDHPTRPPVKTPRPAADWPRANESWGSILQSQPFVYRIEATFQPFTPLVPALNIVAEQVGYRFSGAFGTAPSALPPGTPGVGGGPTDTPFGGGPTAGPTDTPGGPSPTATNTPVPTNTRPPTATPSPTDTPGCYCCQPASSRRYTLPCSTGFCNQYCWPTLTPTPTPCVACTATPTKTPLPTNTPRPSNTPTNTICPPAVCTVTPTPTDTPTPRPTSTPSPTRTPAPPPTPTDTPDVTPTPSSCSTDCVQCALQAGCNCTGCVNQ